MARLTSKNAPIYLSYKSTDQIIREALESHETVGKRWGWVFVISFLLLLFANDVVMFYFLKVM